jgi:hypothetical protein
VLTRHHKETIIGSSLLEIWNVRSGSFTRDTQKAKRGNTAIRKQKSPLWGSTCQPACRTYYPAARQHAAIFAVPAAASMCVCVCSPNISEDLVSRHETPIGWSTRERPGYLAGVTRVETSPACHVSALSTALQYTYTPQVPSRARAI